MYHDTKLTPQEQTKVHTASGSSFKSILDSMKEIVVKQGDIWAEKQDQTGVDKMLDLSW